MIFFGGFGVDGKGFADALVLPDDIVVEVLPSAVVHILDSGKACVLSH
jgi:hypothetical protein